MVLFGNTSLLLLAHLKTHFFTLLLMFGFAWLTEADLPGWDGPLELGCPLCAVRTQPWSCPFQWLCICAEPPPSTEWLIFSRDQLQENWTQDVEIIHRDTGDGTRWWPVQNNLQPSDRAPSLCCLGLVQLRGPGRTQQRQHLHIQAAWGIAVGIQTGWAAALFSSLIRKEACMGSCNCLCFRALSLCQLQCMVHSWYT